MPGVALELFLADSTWGGLVKAHAPGYDALVFSAPKSKLQDLLEYDEVNRSCVYVLTGPSEENSFGLRGYVGESTGLMSRMRSHLRTKKFWNRAYVITTRDGWFDTGHIKFLESQLIQVARRAPLLTQLDNRVDPKQVPMTEGNEATLERFLEVLALIMPSIGCPLFAFPHTLRHAPISAPQPSLNAGQDYFEMAVRDVRATGYVKDGQFWVCAGSSARMEVLPSLRSGYQDSRRKLTERKILILDEGAQRYVFMQDTPFNSPSDAAAVVGGSSLNGRKAWKLRGASMTYGEWERTSAQNESKSQ